MLDEVMIATRMVSSVPRKDQRHHSGSSACRLTQPVSSIRLAPAESIRTTHSETPFHPKLPFHPPLWWPSPTPPLPSDSFHSARSDQQNCRSERAGRPLIAM